MSRDTDIGKALRLARDRWDQLEFGRAVGTSQGHLSRLENGKGDPSWDLLRRAARVAGLTVAELVALGEEE